jgi:hypothetical protein
MPPMCNEGCASSCGCCSCLEGEEHCDDGKIVQCSNRGCYEIAATCADPAACVSFSGDGGVRAICAASKDDCAAVAGAYRDAESLGNLTPARAGSSGLAPGVYNPACSSIDCNVIPGYCDIGLGDTCWYLGRPQPELKRLSALYTTLRCAQPVTCACPPPVGAYCGTNPDGGPAWKQGSISATNACYVR